ncbi:unnamed protein product [Phytomonas sp. Hart1]|nr:unnamed protein product [Phytomonas sp. Hart1]|eukprot:CCW67822.1 unnamed protein product [Phytomonas sp. isolate Hart1]
MLKSLYRPSIIGVSAILTQRRFKMTGFNIFVRETQQKYHLLKAKTLSEGSKNNMKIMSSLWRNISKSEQMKYNHRALVEHIITPRDLSKKNSSFNMVMQMLAKDKVLMNTGDERFVAMLALRTARALSTTDLQKLMRKLNVEMTKPISPMTSNRGVSYFKRMMLPNMRYFSSFTEMQHAVAPTRQILFVSVCSILSGYGVSWCGDSDLKAKFDSLDSEVKAFFNPISEEESFSFETFCAKNCAGYNQESFNIILLFSQFRQIVNKPVIASNIDIAIYRSMLAEERCHEPVYFKVKRALAYAKECRSSDCGTFIYNKTPENMIVAPESYNIHKAFDKVDVATRLAETRRCQSVYDDILDRAAVLRPKENQKKLEMYIVKDMHSESAANQTSAVNKPTTQSSLTFTVRFKPGTKLSNIHQVIRSASKDSKLPVMIDNHQLTRKSNPCKLAVDSTSLTSGEHCITKSTDVTQPKIKRLLMKYSEVLDKERHEEIKSSGSNNQKSNLKKRQNAEYEEHRYNFPTDDSMHMLDDEVKTWDSLDLLPESIEHKTTGSSEEPSSSITSGENMDTSLSESLGTRRILRNVKVQDDVMLNLNHSIIFKHKHKPSELEIASARSQPIPGIGKGSDLKLLKKQLTNL